MATPKRAGNFSHAGRHTKPPPPALSPAELQSGLVALLDTFVASETTPTGDREVLHHARELRRLLCARNNYPSAQPKRDLDAARPDKAARLALPDWVERRLHAAKALPPLPPITEPHLHQAVFTHRTAARDPREPPSARKIYLDLDYERLEFIGDAYIQLIATRALCNRFPHVDVPELCSWRERLVENCALSKLSDAYAFPERLTHHCSAAPGSKVWQKVSADIFEAYVAALVLCDPAQGFQTAEEWLTELWAPQILGFREKVVENAKVRDELGKLVVCKGVTLDYRQDKPMSYDDRRSIQRFYVGIYLTGWGYDNEWVGSGEGRNKSEAAIAAASAAIKNSAVIQDAAQKKADLMQVRRLERENHLKALAEQPHNADHPQAPSAADAPSAHKRKPEADADADADDASLEHNNKKKKKHKHKHNEDNKHTQS